MKFEVEYFANLSNDEAKETHLKNTGKGRVVVEAYTHDSAINKAFEYLKGKYHNAEKMIRILSAKRI